MFALSSFVQWVRFPATVRPVTGAHRRLSEAARLGFRYAVVPKGVLGAGPVPPEVQVVEVGTVLEAVQALAAP